MSKFAQGPYTVKNAAKYVGKGTPRYRSGWEHAFMRFLDNNDHVVNWASESLSIPYRNPVTGKQSMYVPDFLITYRNKKQSAHSRAGGNQTQKTKRDRKQNERQRRCCGSCELRQMGRCYQVGSPQRTYL